MSDPERPAPRGKLRLVTLGHAALQRVPPEGDEPEEVLSPGKPFAVLVYLASTPGQSATRDHLIDLLWANLELDAARHALRQALWYLRKQLGRSAIRSDDGTLHLSVPLTSDRDAFLEAIENEDYRRAVEAYGGEFLPVYAAPGGAEFEKWVDTERYRLRKHFLRATRSLARDRLERGAFGEATELAARARDADPADQGSWRLLLEALLAAGEEVRAQVEARALAERLEEVGRAPEPPLRQVLEAARERRKRPDDGGGQQRLRPELIGRESEFAAILSAWSDARAGQGRHVHVAGAAGLGKSRLLSEVAGRLKAMGARTIELRAHPGEREVPYALTSELAGELADCPGSGEVSDGAARVLAGLNPDLTDRYPDVSGSGDGEELRRRVLALRSLLEAVAAREPLAVLIDDLHWADEKSRQAVVSLLGTVTERSALVVTTARTETDSGRVTLGETKRLSLEPLGEIEVRRLLTSLGALPETDWGSELAGRLVAATGGSPLLVLEILRLAVTEAWLVLEQGTWRCRDPDALERELADGRALRRRIERLPHEARRVLLLLSVAGRPLDGERLDRAAEEGAVTEQLRELEVDGFVASVGGEWAVAHDEIAAAAVEAVGGQELREARRTVGYVLSRSPDDTDDLFRAARHLRAAGDWAGLRSAFRRWALAVRERGDRRSPRQLAADFLGNAPDAEEARNLVADLPLRARLTLLPTRRLAVAAGLLLAVGAAAAGAVFQAGAPSPDTTLYVLRPAEGGTVRGREVPVFQGDLTRESALDLEDAGSTVPALSRLEPNHPVRPRPFREQWATSRTVPGSAAGESYLLREDGSARRLTRSPADDSPMTWSPDGRYLLINTSRWNRYGWHDLAILDMETGDLRQLTTASSSGPGNVHGGSWSPDGTRVAFELKDHGRGSSDSSGRLCWTPVHGERRECVVVPGRRVHLVGWHGSDALLATVTDSGGERSLERVDLATGATETVDDEIRQAVVSRGGRWVASLRVPEGQAPRWHVYRPGRPDRSLPLAGSGDLSRWSLSWSDVGTRPDYLDRVEISAPDTLVRGVPVQLSAEGFTRDGIPASIPVLTWSTVDPERAAVDPESGVLRPTAPGSVTVVASAGGWRADTVRLPVEEASSRTVLTEDWSGELEPAWVPFGEPRPSLGRHPDLGRAFWARGDGLYYSGVYSRRPFEASAGLGVITVVSTPRTAPAEQELWVAINTWRDPAAVDAWDHRTGSVPGTESACNVHFPAGDGLSTSSQLQTAGRTVELGRDLGSGEPYRLTLQLFPDGTCGVAVDGEPVARSRQTVGDLQGPHRVVLQGKSVDTEILVGRLRAWKGVRGRVDWSRLDRWSVGEEATSR